MPQIPAGWEEITLGKACIVMSWSTPSTKEELYRDWDISWITPKDLSNYNERYIAEGERNITEAWVKNSSAQILPPNTILFSSRAPIWYVAIAKKELTTNQGFKNIICDEKESHYLFFYYWLKYRSEYIEKISSGSTFTEASAAIMRSLPIHLPPLPEQQAIAAVLSSFDDKIELLRAENQTLEQMGQELFKERFGKWKVGDELPEGWRVGKLGEKNFAEIIGSWIERFDREKIYLATADVINSSISNSNTKITYQDRPSRANMQPTEKSIWFAKMQDSRKLLMFDDYSQDEIENYILSTWFAGIKTSELSHYYLWCFVLSDDFDMIKNNMANGAVQIAVNNSNLEKIEILISNEEFLRKFNEFVKPLFKKIYLNNKQITSLSATRDQLLPKLMSWEVRVKI